MLARRDRLTSFLILLSFAAWPQPASAQWRPNGIPVCEVSGDQQFPVIVPDGAGGAIIAWRDSRSDTAVAAQHLNAAGSLLWGPRGVPVTTANPTCFGSCRSLVGAPDIGHGAIFAWVDYGDNHIHAQRVDSAGARQWPPSNGVTVSTSAASEFDPVLATDGAGGAFVAWRDYRGGPGVIEVQHISSAGVVDTTNWPADGLVISGAPDGSATPMIISDDNGGMLVGWSVGGGYGGWVQRITSSGAISPGWPAGGVRACQSSACLYDGIEAMAPDGSGGAIVVWTDGRNFGQGGIYAQHINAAGTLAWRLGGDSLCVAGYNRGFPKLVSDGLGGAIAVWNDIRSGCSTCNPDSVWLYAQRADPSGQQAWASEGVPVCKAPEQPWASWITTNMVADGNHGAIIAWRDGRAYGTTSNYDIYVQRLTPSGVDSGWIRDGVPVCTDISVQDEPALATDGATGAIIAWTDSRNTATGLDIYAQRVYSAGGVANVPLGQPVSFAFHPPHPNPLRHATTISFDLPASQHVSVAICDVSGRLVRTLVANRELPAGRQSVIWNGESNSGGPARAGVYFIRVTAVDEAIASRVVVIR